MTAMVGFAITDRPKVTLLDGGRGRLERLARLPQERPELAGIVPFWLAIYQVQLEIWDELSARLPQPWTLRPAKVAVGQPQLEFSDLALMMDRFAQDEDGWTGLTDAGQRNATHPANPVHPVHFRTRMSALEHAWRAHDPQSVAAEETDWPARMRQVFADPTCWFGQRRELAFEDALAILALEPYLEWLAPRVVQALGGDLDVWGRGYCPVCGGWPELAVLVGEPALRFLVCSRCCTAWPYRRVACPFCGDQEHQVYYPAEDGKRRLDACQACRRYLKTLEGRYYPDGLDPRVARLTTVAMDVAALKAGYGPA